MWFAGTTGLNGEEFVRFDTLQKALDWMRDCMIASFWLSARVLLTRRLA